MTDYRVGIDVGGTFTDLVLTGRDSVVTKKVPSTPDDFSRGLLEGLTAVLSEEGLDGEALLHVVHGMTVISNAVIEKKGASTGLLTTKGFRDALEIGRLTTPSRFDMSWNKPKPLVERYLRREVRERITSAGDVFVPLHTEDVEEAVVLLVDQGVTSIAVCFINSYVNPEHEALAGETIKRIAPHVSVSLSHEVLPEVKEYERTSTTVVDAYVKPLVSEYLRRVEQGLGDAGVAAPLLVMQSNGGIMTAKTAEEKPIHTAESGPAAGVVGVLKLGRRIGERNLISFDMGGTTAKAAVIHDDAPELCSEFEIGGESTGGWRFVKGGGYLLRVPAIDIAEVGSGGGSIAWVDAAGVPQVGPQSAGADPGPVCYDLGGPDPTITDANVLLGYFNPDYLVGGALRLNVDRARQVFQDEVAGPTGLSLEEAAYGVYSIANARMQQAVRAVTTERGRDPSDYMMVGYGGCGPAHVVPMARQLGIREVLIPPASGVFSSAGLLEADLEHHYVRTYWRDVNEVDLDRLNSLLDEMQTEAYETFEGEGVDRDETEMSLTADMRYTGQGHDLGVPVAAPNLDIAAVDRLARHFHEEHEATFGYRSNEPVQIFRLRLVARAAGSHEHRELQSSVHGAAGTGATRRAYFGTDSGWRETRVLQGREALGGDTFGGPVIIEEYDSTTVVPPGASATLDRWGNVRIGL